MKWTRELANKIIRKGPDEALYAKKAKDLLKKVNFNCKEIDKAKGPELLLLNLHAGRCIGRYAMKSEWSLRSDFNIIRHAGGPTIYASFKDTFSRAARWWKRYNSTVTDVELSIAYRELFSDDLGGLDLNYIEMDDMPGCCAASVAIGMSDHPIEHTARLIQKARRGEMLFMSVTNTQSKEHKDKFPGLWKKAGWKQVGRIRSVNHKTINGRANYVYFFCLQAP